MHQRKYLLTAGCSLILFFGSVAKQKDPRTFETFQSAGISIEYAIQLPSNFEPNKAYPVLIGPGDGTPNSSRSYYWQDIQDTEGWILVEYKIYEFRSRKAQIKALLDHLLEEYKIEERKFHTVCFSANSAGIFNMVMEIPGYFAGITGMAGNPNISNKEKLKNLQTVKVQFVVGDKDSYWMRAAQRSHAALQELGVNSQIEIIKNGKHVLTGLIGKGFLERANRLR